MDSRLKISICHPNRLLSDCLAVALNDAFRSEDVGVTTEVLEYDPISPSKILFGLEANILIVDASLGSAFLESLITAARKRVNDCKVMLLVRDFCGTSGIELFSLGTNACVYSESSFAELVLGIKSISDGGNYCSAEVANAFLASMNHAGSVQPAWLVAANPIRLTGREREVLELIAWERLGNKQIARRLGISLYTVKNHVHNILEKLGVENRHEAAAVATRQQILVAAE